MARHPFGTKPLPGTIPQLRDSWVKTQGYFTIKQSEANIYQVQLIWKQIEYKYYKNRNTTQSVCEPWSEPTMVRYAPEGSKIQARYFQQACIRSVWASVIEFRLCDEIEAFEGTLKTHLSFSL